MNWSDHDQSSKNRWSRCILQISVLMFALCLFTSTQILILDAIRRWKRPFRVYGQILVLWVFPLIAVVDLSWFFKASSFGAIVLSYIMSELCVVFHDLYILKNWTLVAPEIALFVRFALIQALLKSFVMLTCTSWLKTGSQMTFICAATGIFFAIMYNSFPIVLEVHASVTWQLVGESTLFQLLYTLLGVSTGLLMYTFNRPPGILCSIAFDAPIVGMFVWWSLYSGPLATLYQCLLLLGVAVVTVGMYYVSVYRRVTTSDRQSMIVDQSIVVVS